GIPGDNPLSAEQFRETLKRLDAIVIDLRRPEAFGGSHITSAFNIGSDQNLPLWAAWAAAAVKGEGPKKLERLIDLYRQRGSNMTHADIIAMNRSLNPLD